MRPLELLRSRTGDDGLSVSLEPHQFPVILYDQSEGGSSASCHRLGLTVTVRSDVRRHVGGMSLVRKVLVKRRIPNSKQWGEWEELQSEKVEALGDCWVEGTQRFECSLPLPQRLPETRRTFYDTIVHLITATIHDTAPLYSSSPAQLRIRRQRMQTTLAHRGAVQGHQVLAPIGEEDTLTCDIESGGERHHEVLATCRRLFEVVHCSSPPGDIPALQWGQTLRLADSGKVTVGVSSDLFVLGSHLDLVLDFTSLTPATTIHAVSAKLIQETSTPIKSDLPDISQPVSASASPPVPPTAPRSTRRGERARRPVLSRLPLLWTSVKEKPPIPKTSIYDEYLLLTEGEDHIVNPRGFEVRKGSTLWRGERGLYPSLLSTASLATHSAARTPTSQGSSTERNNDGKPFQPNTEVRTASSLRLQRHVRLPSSLQSATPTSSTLAPILAKVSHRLEVDVIYSILGQDQLGRPLPTGSASREGSLRLARGFVEVKLGACTMTPAAIQPPTYTAPLPERLPPSPSAPRRRLSGELRRLSIRSFESRRKPTTPSPPPPNKTIPHTRAFMASNGIVIGGKSVFYDEEEARLREGEHISKSRGGCACAMGKEHESDGSSRLGERVRLGNMVGVIE